MKSPVYLQAMYNEFSTVNIQIDKDFSAKLSGYGCVGLLPEADPSDISPVSAWKLLLVHLILVLHSMLIVIEALVFAPKEKKRKKEKEALV